ncbi:MAG: hypothetical protein GX442_08555 [Candidatus Riflebacteria bacterium]|nr:hypothetical protein [Candidatus Riflebacteria bacterium]
MTNQRPTDPPAAAGCPLGSDREGLLFDLAEGTLDPSRTADLNTHLAGCPACRQALEAVRRGDGRLRGLRPHVPDLDLVPRVMERVAPAPGPAAVPFLWKVVGTLALAAGLALLAFSGGGGPAGPGPISNGTSGLATPPREGNPPATPPTDLPAQPLLPAVPAVTPAPLPVAALGPSATIVLAAAAGSWEPRLPPGPLAVGVPARFQTGAGSRLEFRLDPGGRVAVGADTVVELAPDEVSLPVGVAWFEVGPRAAGRPPFRVRTPQGRVEVTGTRFGVRAQASGTEVVLVEGGVAWEGTAGHRDLAAGQRLVADHTRVTVETVVAADLADWNRLAEGPTDGPAAVPPVAVPPAPVSFPAGVATAASGPDPLAGQGWPASQTASPPAASLSPRDILNGHSLKRSE